MTDTNKGHFDKIDQDDPSHAAINRLYNKTRKAADGMSMGDIIIALGNATGRMMYASGVCGHHVATALEELTKCAEGSYVQEAGGDPETDTPEKVGKESCDADEEPKPSDVPQGIVDAIKAAFPGANVKVSKLEADGTITDLGEDGDDTHRRRIDAVNNAMGDVNLVDGLTTLANCIAGTYARSSVDCAQITEEVVKQDMAAFADAVVNSFRVNAKIARADAEASPTVN